MRSWFLYLGEYSDSLEALHSFRNFLQVLQPPVRDVVLSKPSKLT